MPQEIAYDLICRAMGESCKNLNSVAWASGL